jgi:hypothetical protein
MKKLCKLNYECIFVFSKRRRTIYVFESLHGIGYLQSTEALKLERNSQTSDFAVAKVKRYLYIYNVQFVFLVLM